MIGDNAKITVVQIKPGHKPMNESPYPYRVKEATNTTLHRIGELLRKDRVEELIGMGITVKIVAPKDDRIVR